MWIGWSIFYWGFIFYFEIEKRIWEFMIRGIFDDYLLGGGFCED